MIAMQSKRKPHNNTPGYVCELKARLGGHIVIYDRFKGADWIDAAGRYVVMHEPSTRHVAVHSMRQAREVMKGVATATDFDYATIYADILPRGVHGQEQ